MLEAKLGEAGILKKLLDATKELVTDANFECTEEGISLQAMDNSHVALVAISLESKLFISYRCDRPMPLGVNLTSLTKVIKCAKDDDVCTLKASDDADLLNLVYEAKNADRIAEYEMKLMDIDADQLGIPDTDYDARVSMPVSEFARIVRDLSQLGESVRIEVSKEGARFSSEGEAANGNVLLKHSLGKIGKIKSKAEDEDEDGEGSGEKTEVKKEKDDDDVEMNEDQEEEDQGKDGEFKANSDDEGEDEQENDDDAEDEGTSKKRKKKTNGSSKPSKKAKTKKSEEDEQGVNIELNQHVSLTFSLKYLVNFTKSSSLTTRVQLMMSNEVPLLVAYEFEHGYIRYYLAPKIGDE